MGVFIIPSEDLNFSEKGEANSSDTGEFQLGTYNVDLPTACPGKKTGVVPNLVCEFDEIGPAGVIRTAAQFPECEECTVNGCKNKATLIELLQILVKI